MSGIERALCGLKSERRCNPVYELLGGKMREQVRVYANGWSYDCASPDDYRRAAERPLRDGYSALKCYPLATPNGRGSITHVSRRSVDREFANCAFDKVRA